MKFFFDLEKQRVLPTKAQETVVVDIHFQDTLLFKNGEIDTVVAVLANQFFCSEFDRFFTETPLRPRLLAREQFLSHQCRRVIETLEEERASFIPQGLRVNMTLFPEHLIQNNPVWRNADLVTAIWDAVRPLPVHPSHTRPLLSEEGAIKTLPA